MSTPTLDIETYSEAGHEMGEDGKWHPPAGAKQMGLAACGSAAYAEHPTTDVLTLSYDLCDGQGIRRWRPGQTVPLDIVLHIAAGGVLEFHKADFERGIWQHVLVARYGWPDLPLRQQRCSMAKALVAQYPPALGNLGAVLGLNVQKDTEGTRLIKKFSVPQQPIPELVDKRTGKVKREYVPARRIMPADDPEDFERFCAYCDTDVRSQMEASDCMPAMEPAELEAWFINEEMNILGLGVDRAGLEDCIAILEQVFVRYGEECRELTGFNVTQLDKLKGWLAAYGVHVTSLDAEALDTLLKREDLPAPARRVLELRALTGSASVKKTYAMRNQLCRDDRLRNLTIHHGTSPGRNSGDSVQPLNLPKAGPKLAECGGCKRPFKLRPLCPWCGAIAGPALRVSWRPEFVDHVLSIISSRSLELVEHFFGDALLAVQGCVRGLFVAAPGHVLVATDYSSIQAVVAAEIAGEQWRIDAFHRGDPIYLLSASKITGLSLEFYLQYAETHGEHHLDRAKIGKINELANGFQGWINSARAFGSTETDEVIKAQILAWREASPAIVEAWGGQWRGPPWRRIRHELFGLEGMFIAAVQNPGTTYEYRGIRFCMETPDCLVMRLLSGRPLYYREPRLEPSARNPDELSISFMTWNTNINYGPRGYIRKPTWGGRIFENAVMGVEVDIQRDGVRRLREHGYPLCLTVYDEDVAHIKADMPVPHWATSHVDAVERLLGVMPKECEGWPIRAAGGYIHRRYRKAA